MHDRGYAVIAITFHDGTQACAPVLGDATADRLQQAISSRCQPFDWIYERALLCALPPALWTHYAEAAARLLEPGGQLVGFFFIDDAAPDARRARPLRLAKSTTVRRFRSRRAEAIDPESRSRCSPGMSSGSSGCAGKTPPRAAMSQLPS
jgi:hypothetical protein